MSWHEADSIWEKMNMDEVIGILIALGALIGGLLALGWSYGDFRKR